MSQRNSVSLTCPDCGNKFATVLYRTIWGEHQENRDLVMNDKINVAACPSCGVEFRAPYALFYNDAEILCGVWWEPHPEPEIDECAAGWAKMFGADNYMAKAPRIKDWEEFKLAIGKFYSGETEGNPPIQTDLSKRKARISRPPKLKKTVRRNIGQFLTALMLLAALSTAIASLFRIKHLNERIADLEYEVENGGSENSSELSSLDGRIDDLESYIYELQDDVDDLQRYSHYHY